MKWVQNQVAASHSHTTCPPLYSLLLILLRLSPSFLSLASCCLLSLMKEGKKTRDFIVVVSLWKGGNRVRRGKSLVVLMLSWNLCSSSQCRLLLVDIRLLYFRWIFFNYIESSLAIHKLLMQSFSIFIHFCKTIFVLHIFYLNSMV